MFFLTIVKANLLASGPFEICDKSFDFLAHYKCLSYELSILFLVLTDNKTSAPFFCLEELLFL